MRYSAVIWLLVLGLLACQDDKDRQEVISKLRPLGVSQKISGSGAVGRVIPMPGESVTLTFHVACPKGVTLHFEPIVAADRFQSTAPISDLVVGTEGVTELASFSYRQMEASFTVPSAADLAIAPGQSRRLRYNVLVAGGGESITIVGDVLVFDTGAPEAQWLGVVGKITRPDGGLGAKAEVPLGADLTKPNTHEEDYKVGWFVGGGEVKNRRARETTWTTPEAPGTYTVVFTAHGKKTKSFTIDVKDVTVL